MRDVRRGRKFGRKTGQRKALMKTLASSLILHKKIRTTEAKAKELRTFVEPMITRARKGTIADRRNLEALVSKQAAVSLMDIAKNYQDRNGGFLRISKIGPRADDAAPLVYIEFV